MVNFFVKGINCNLNQCCLWWQTHLDITMSQLLEQRYHVMHIRLPDRHNVANHFCLAISLSLRAKFFKFVYCLVFHKVRHLLARTSLRLLISFRVTPKVFSASRSCPWCWLLSSLQSCNWYLVARGVQFQTSC